MLDGGVVEWYFGGEVPSSMCLLQGRPHARGPCLPRIHLTSDRLSHSRPHVQPSARQPSSPSIIEGQMASPHTNDERVNCCLHRPSISTTGNS